MAVIDEAYNKKIQNRGSWIDKCFLEDLLSNKYNTDVSVSDFSIAAAVAEGENYLSTLYKTNVIYTVNGSSEESACNIMIKGLPESPVTIEKINENNTFEKERFVYLNVLAKMRNLIREYFPPGTAHIAPEEYFTAKPDTLVMEDLTHDGYQMKFRQEQLDYEHGVHTLRVLARYHALSVKLYEEDPGIIDGACSCLYTDASRSYLSAFIEEGLRTVIDEMKTWSEFDDAEDLADKLENVTPYCWEKVEVLEQANNAKFRVINHGDLWMNNVMFKYDNDGQIHSVKLVDFQLSRFTSPAMDIHFVLITSFQAEVLQSHLFDLISQYHDALTSDMAILGVTSDYSLTQLHEDMRDYAVFGLASATSFTAIVLAPDGGTSSDENAEFLVGIRDGEEHSHIMLPIFRTLIYKVHAMGIFRLFDLVGYMEDARTRLQYVVDDVLKEENDANSDEEFADGTAVFGERVMSAHDRHVLARLKSSVKGYLRRFMDV